MNGLFPVNQQATVALLDLDVATNKSRSNSNSSYGSSLEIFDPLFLLTTAEGELIDDDMNTAIHSNIRRCVISAVADPASKRKVFENAINAGYKKVLNQLFDEIRQGGVQINLDSVDLSGLDLSDLNLSGVSAARCNFTNANLKRADLSHASLVDADLSGANALKTNFDGTVFESTLVNRFVTDNPWLARSFESHTDSLSSNVDVSNAYLNGIGQPTVSGRQIHILPARTVKGTSCPCVIL